jgi:hypothetical protein
MAFGEAWCEAGQLERWLAPWLYIMLCDSGIIVFIITGHQKLALIMHAIQWLLRLIAILIGAMINDFHTTVILYSAVSMFSYGFFIHKEFKVVHTKLSIAINSHAKAISFGFLCLSPVLFLSQKSSTLQVHIITYALVFSLMSIRYFVLYRYEK